VATATTGQTLMSIEQHTKKEEDYSVKPSKLNEFPLVLSFFTRVIELLQAFDTFFFFIYDM
jgi:hypothetical protein